MSSLPIPVHPTSCADRVSIVCPVTLALMPIVPHVFSSLPSLLCLLSSFSCTYASCSGFPPRSDMSIPNRAYAYDGTAESTVSGTVCARVACLNSGPGKVWICVVECCRCKAHPHAWPWPSCYARGALQVAKRKATMDRTARKAATKACCACCPFRSCAYCAPTSRPPMPIV